MLHKNSVLLRKIWLTICYNAHLLRNNTKMYNCTNPNRERDKVCDHKECRWYVPWGVPACKDCTLKPCQTYQRVDDSRQMQLDLFGETE